MLDNCVLNRPLNENIRHVLGYEEFTGLFEICQAQKKLNEYISANKKIIIIPEVFEEFARYLKKLKEKKFILDDHLRKKFVRNRTLYKHNKKIYKKRYQHKPSDIDKVITPHKKRNQKLFARYYDLIYELYEVLQKKVITYEELPVSQDAFDDLEGKIWKVQKDVGIPENKRMTYSGTDEKLIAAALIIGKYEQVNLFTISPRVFDTMINIAIDYLDLYSQQELENLKNRTAVKTVFFDSWFTEFEDINFPQKSPFFKHIYPVENLPSSIPRESAKSRNLSCDFSKFA